MRHVVCPTARHPAATRPARPAHHPAATRPARPADHPAATRPYHPVPSPGAAGPARSTTVPAPCTRPRSEEHTSELQSRGHLVCRLLLEKKKKTITLDYSRNQPLHEENDTHY